MPHPLETERLWLRPFSMGDIDEAYQLFDRHPEVWKYDPGHPRTKEQRQVLIQKYTQENQPDGFGTLALIEKKKLALIGYAGLERFYLASVNRNQCEAGIFYKLGYPYWGNGYAMEACQALIDFAFQEMGVTKLIGLTDPENERSIRLLQRLGMQFQPAPRSWSRSLIGILENFDLKCIFEE